MSVVTLEPGPQGVWRYLTEAAARRAALVVLAACAAIAVLGSPPARHLLSAPPPDALVFADDSRRVIAAGLKPGWWPGFEDAPFFEPLPATHLLDVPRVTSAGRTVFDPARPLGAAKVAVVESYRREGSDEAVPARSIVVGDAIDVTYRVENLSSETLRDIVIDDPVLGSVPLPRPLEPYAETSVRQDGVTVPPRVDGADLPRRLLGTDPLGRDLAARLAGGAWRLLLVAGGSGALAFALGGGAGWAAARRGRSLVSALGRARLVLVTFPFLLVALLVVMLVDASVPLLVLLTAVVSIPITGRRVRDTVVALRRSQRVETAIASGRAPRDIRRTIVGPAVASAAGATALGVVAAAAVVETSLAYLALGPMPPAVSLGTVVADVRYVIDTSAGYLLLPGALIIGVTLSAVVLMESLGHRDATLRTGATTGGRP